MARLCVCSMLAMLPALRLLGSSLNVGWLVTLVVAVLLIRVGLDVYVRLQWLETEMVPISVTT